MLEALGIPLVILMVALAILGTVVFVARNYVKCPPNMVLIFSGRKHKVRDAQGKVIGKRGYRFVTGGAGFRIPLLEIVDRLPLTTFQVEAKIVESPNRDGVLITLDAVANLKVSSDPEVLPAAVERLLGKENIREVAKTTLEGILREIAGTLSIEEIITERQMISQQVQSTATMELAKLGLRIDNFVITKVDDEQGYIRALGKKKTAEVIRDAVIGEAEAKREADIKSAAAQREGETAKANAEEQISNAERQRDVVKAENTAAVKSKQARIDVAAETAREDERKRLEVAKIAADQARVVAETELQSREQERRSAELDATTVIAATKEKEARIIRADAEREAAEREGEARRILEAKTGQGDQARLTAQAEGRKAAADALQREKEAEAAGDRARLLAEADGDKAKRLAVADGEKAKLLAEAEGYLKKMQALATMNAAARTIITLEMLPQIIEHAGEAGEKVVGGMFEHVGTGLSRIDNLTMVDMGSGNGDATPVERLALSIPKVIFKTLAEGKALGINLETLLEKLGIDSSQLLGSLKTAAEADATDESGQA
jgi:flotillin